ncbi:MAG: DoxX family protein [Erythrobacter sp.]|uniref:DoxX family protein n=1 Tax=Erythrobacter sp. TaxID=1042 RepID=UPI003266AF4B
MTKAILRILLAAFYAFAGYLHLVRPEPFLSIMPVGIPYPQEIVYWTGVAEILGAIALAQPFHKRLRQAGGIGLALYAICVWPANINHFIVDMAREDGGLGLAYHVPRMFAQPLIIWLAFWVGNVPFPKVLQSKSN